MTVAEIQKCRDCGHEFGTDEAEFCKVCHSYICPHCGRCLCARVKGIFDSLSFAFA